MATTPVEENLIVNNNLTSNIITVTGTVDSRDISNDGATLDSHTAATSAHGASGSLVGTDNTQTLTNKTLTNTNNNIAANALFNNTTKVTIGGTCSNGAVLRATSSTNANWNIPINHFVDYRESLAVSSTTSTTFVTKLSYTINLPLGDYLLFASFQAQIPSGNYVTVEQRLNGVMYNESYMETDNDWPGQCGVSYLSNYSGNITHALVYKSSVATASASIRNVCMWILRVG